MTTSKTRKRIGYWLFLSLFIIIAAEIILRIYNPFPSSVVGDKIILSPNYSKIYKNKGAVGDMEPTIIYKRNSIGFRGQEPPAPFKDYLTIVAVGGSTTECMFISEGKTWEDQLAGHLAKSFPRSWINNAGFAGHSTFGHIVLLRDYIVALKPSVCLFLIGGNDIDRNDLRPNDENFTKTKQRWVLNLAKKSVLVNTLLTIYRNHLAKEKNVADRAGFSLLNKAPLNIPDSIIQKKLKLQEPLLAAYASRLKELIRLCKQNQIEPIFVTQPCLPGEVVDSISSVNLATFPMSAEINGKLFWKYMELYNAETKKVAETSGVFLVDLANELPKSSAYFYDLIHYNNAGNARVAEIISIQLIPYLRKKFPQFSSGK
jgi:lysophospholipase L1-like esterase